MLVFITLFLIIEKGHAAGLLDEWLQFFGVESPEYSAIIIDCGSSGSRVHSFKFREPFTLFKPSRLKLATQFFESVKPGLSSYASDPEQGAESIVELVKKAQFNIPEQMRKTTPIMVRATAGLRLLPPEVAQGLLDAVASAIRPYSEETSVDMLKSADEGIFNWYSTNYLLNTLENKFMSWGALDLGGGSTQITYEMTHYDGSAPAESLYELSVVDRNVVLLSHSFLGLGTNSARIGTFRLEANDALATELTSICVHPDTQQKEWNEHGLVFKISGATRYGVTTAIAFNLCHDVVRRYVTDKMDWKMARRPDVRFAAVDGYFFNAEDAGLIDASDSKNKKGRVKVQDYRSAAMRQFGKENKEDPWLAFNLVFVYSMLHDGYKMDDYDEIFLIRKVDGIVASWALGMAYNILSDKVKKDNRIFFAKKRF